MVSAISFGWVADFGKTLTTIQRSSQPVHSDKHPLSQFMPGPHDSKRLTAAKYTRYLENVLSYLEIFWEFPERYLGNFRWHLWKGLADIRKKDVFSAVFRVMIKSIQLSARKVTNCSSVTEKKNCKDPAWLNVGSHRRCNQPNLKSKTMRSQRPLQDWHNVEYLKQYFGWPDQVPYFALL